MEIRDVIEGAFIDGERNGSAIFMSPWMYT